MIELVHNSRRLRVTRGVETGRWIVMVFDSRLNFWVLKDSYDSSLSETEAIANAVSVVE